MSLDYDFDSVKGLRAAVQDNGHPVFSPYIDTSVEKVDTQKQPHHYKNFFGGNSYFYIPPYPYKGAI